MKTGMNIDGQRLIFNGKELSNDEDTLWDCNIQNNDIIYLNSYLLGGKLHGQIFQKSLLYMRPRGFMGIKDEKLHCLMMAKLVNTKQIHLLTLCKYFYARLALYHFHPREAPQNFKRIRAAEQQKKPFLFPRF